MFERFTDEARLAMARANAVAEKFYHDFVGAEHIFLGLRGFPNHAMDILKNLGINPEEAVSLIEKKIRKGDDTRDRPIKRQRTPRAKDIVNFAISSAEGSVAVDTEHLLLGLLERNPHYEDESQSLPYRILTKMGVTSEKVRMEMSKLNQDG